MSLENLYQQYAGSTEAAQWTPDTMPCPPRVHAETHMVEPSGHHGPSGHHQIDKQEYKPEQVTATPAEIAAIIGGLKTAGRSLGLVEALAREAMAQLTREAAAELAVVLDDAFAVAPDDATARAHCRRLLTDPQALAAAKAVWPGLPPALVAIPQATTSAPVVDHAPRWLRLIRENCPLVPEDEKLLTRCLAMRPSREALEAAKQYVITWKHAASIEARQAARDNAGRRAANNELRGGNRHAG
ncbi:hypothetical protein LCGC14_0185190 [marine sediment metagenome]|uniref:Uncharacterized protein n=1 Tax=marine sediment metagenome TaxID=412755 RepID=A0A0F9XQT8_9ZZZZ|nr:hypothetical protein [Halomonas sp.]HDZ49287.1 hypothetical protein [Halomonas sp.]HEB05134.1 hypothetical protein [Halomonas sp.]